MHQNLKQNNETTEENRNEIQFKHLNIHPLSREVYINESLVNLTQKEYDLLLYFIQNKNQALTREQIIEAVWGYEYYGDTNVIDVYVRYLRKKLDQNDISLISSVRGIGYMIKD